MNKELRDLEDRMSKLSDEALLQMVNVDTTDYRRIALDLAERELLLRGHSKEQIDRDSSKHGRRTATDDNGRESLARLWTLGVGTGLVALGVFPALSFYSILVYGLPASLFMMLGYEVWYFLRRAGPRLASAFSIGFIPPIVFGLFVLILAVPSYAALVLLEFLCFWLIHYSVTTLVSLRAYR